MLFGLTVVLAIAIVRQGAPQNGEQSNRPDASERQAPNSVELTAVSVPRLSFNQGAAAKLAQKQAAANDDWDTEQLSEQIANHLNAIAQELISSESLDHEPSSQELKDLLASDFECTPLRPPNLAEVFRDPDFVARRWTPTQLTHESGAAVLKQQLKSLSDALGSKNPHVKIKLFEINESNDEIQTRNYVEAYNHGTNQTSQSNSTWSCLWRRSNTFVNNLVLVRITLEAYEETVTNESGPLFGDCTAAVLSNNPAYSEQVVPSLSYWLNRIGREFMTQFGHHGIAVGDVNGDNLDDLYVCDAGGLPNRLYVQQPDGTAKDVSASAGVDILEDSVGALIVDLDNDGDQDLVVATDPLVHFAENDGSGKFHIHRGYYANTDSYSLCAADYDQDGDIDIYVCGYNARKQDPVNRGLPFPLPYHDANNGGRNYLLRNDGNFRFVDATAETGLDENNTRFSLAAAWEDFDNDGDQDLYVANDFGRNCLYENTDGHFVDIAANTGVEDHASGMSVSWGDPNRDGQMDVYVSNMFSAAGHRVTYQRRFTDGIGNQELSLIQRMARGNTLFQQAAQGSFEDVSENAGVTLGRWAWGSRFADVNNDGWEDLLVANGYVTSDDKDDL